jgi:hypothetical protein
MRTISNAASQAAEKLGILGVLSFAKRFFRRLGLFSPGILSFCGLWRPFYRPSGTLRP